MKERIREAALRLFAEQGFHGVSVRDICRDANTTLPMVYYYYGNKQGLHDTLLQELIDWRVRRIEAARRYGGDITGRLRVVIEAWAGHDDPGFPRQMHAFYMRELAGMGAGGNRRSLERIDRELRGALKDIVQDGIDEGLFRPVNVSMVVVAIIGIVNAFRSRMALGAEVTLEDAIEQVTDTLLQGVVARDESRPPPEQSDAPAK